MKKIMLRSLVGIIAMGFVVEMPTAFALFGIRAAKTAIAARKARQMTSSSSSDAEEAYAQEKAKFGKPVRTGRVTKSSTSSTLKGEEQL